MVWWKLALLFFAGFVVGAMAWGASDLALLDESGQRDLEAADVEPTELFDDAAVPDAPVSKMSPQERAKSFPIGGRSFFGVSNFHLDDPQGRTVLKVKTLRGNFDLDELPTGVYRGSVQRAEEIELWLYRAPSGEVSLAEAFRTAPPPVRADLGLELLPGSRTMEVGPVQVARTRLHMMLTDTPILFELEGATMYARQRPGEEAPEIFIEDATARMLEPQPFPKPVTIPYATAVLSLSGEPLVDLTAVACVNGEPLKVRVVVPTTVSRVFITADAGSSAGDLAVVGLKTTGGTEGELEVKTGPVTVRKSVDCSGRQVVRIDADDNIIEE